MILSHSYITCSITSTSYWFPFDFWWPLNFEPLYSNDLDTPCCLDFAGGGGGGTTSIGGHVTLTGIVPTNQLWITRWMITGSDSITKLIIWIFQLLIFSDSHIYVPKANTHYISFARLLILALIHHSIDIQFSRSFLL